MTFKYISVVLICCTVSSNVWGSEIDVMVSQIRKVEAQSASIMIWLAATKAQYANPEIAEAVEKDETLKNFISRTTGLKNIHDHLSKDEESLLNKKLGQHNLKSFSEWYSDANTFLQAKEQTIHKIVEHLPAPLAQKKQEFDWEYETHQK